MILYKGCIAIREGIMKPHTLSFNGHGISISYVNNLNYESVYKYLKENGLFHAANAIDTKGNKYKIYINKDGTLKTAVKNEYIKPLSIPEMIKKYHLDITEKEYEVIQLVAEGFSNKEIAQKLFLSEGTVRNYLSIILEKLCLRDRTQLAIFYLKSIKLLLML